MRLNGSVRDRQGVSPVLSYIIVIFVIIVSTGIAYVTVTGLVSSMEREIASEFEIVYVGFGEVDGEKYVNVTIDNYAVVPLAVREISLNGTVVFDDSHPVLITYDGQTYETFTTIDEVKPNTRGTIRAECAWADGEGYRLLVVPSKGEPKVKRCYS